MRPFLTLVRRDVVAETRRLQAILSMAIFALVVMVVLHYGWDVGPEGPGSARSAGTVPAAMLWVVFVFAAILGLARTFAPEREDDCLDGLLLLPVDRFTLFLAKATTNLLLLLVLQIVVVPVFALFFLERGVAHLPAFVPVALLADVGMAAVGTFVATLVLRARSRDLVLPVVMLPLLVPLVIAATSATAAVVDGGAGLAAVAGRLGFLAGYDAVMLLVAWGTCGILVSE